MKASPLFQIQWFDRGAWRAVSSETWADRGRATRGAVGLGLYFPGEAFRVRPVGEAAA